MSSLTIVAQPPTNPHPGHDSTPTGMPSWYGAKLGREERSWLSKTGDVELLAGNTFGVPYPTFGAAVDRARSASAEGAGAVFVMRPAPRDAHAGEFWLTRSYNAEYTEDRGLYVGRSHFDGSEKGFSNFHPEVTAVVDGDFVLTPPR